MRHRSLFYTRAARTRLHMLPAQVRLHLETHLENLALLAERLPPERLPLFVAREDEGFVTTVADVYVHFTVSAAVHALLVHRIDAEALEQRGGREESAADGGP